jgi:hypothetical protein
LKLYIAKAGPTLIFFEKLLILFGLLLSEDIMEGISLLPYMAAMTELT